MKLIRTFGLTLTFFFTGLTGMAHPVSLNWVNIEILDNKLVVRYRILLEDLVYFHRPSHDEFYDYNTEMLRSLAVSHGKMVAENFAITDDAGQMLTSGNIRVNDRSLSGDQINLMDLMKYEISYTIDYQLNVKSWDYFILNQKMGRGDIKIPVVTFLSVQLGEKVLAKNIEMSSDAAFTLYRYGNNQTVNPSKLISSYFSVSTTGIRHELTIPAGLLNNLMGNPSDNEIVTDQLYHYFSNQNPVFINGKKPLPRLHNIRTFEQTGDKDFLYLDLYYPSDNYPGDVKLSWTDYNWQFRWMQSMIMATDSSFEYTFSRFQPQIQWQNRILLKDNND